MIPTNLDYTYIKSLYNQKSYSFLESNEAVNLFGYRSKDLLVDHFNDILGVAYKDYFGNTQCLTFPGTTKPGLHYLKEELGNPAGTFILQPGSYINCWTIGLHSGKYTAYVQSGVNIFKGWRDKNQDGKFDYSGATYTDSTGVDGHTVRLDIDVNDVVYNASAGCQVCRDGKHFGIWLSLGLRMLEVFPGTKFNYTLFQEV